MFRTRIIRRICKRSNVSLELPGLIITTNTDDNVSNSLTLQLYHLDEFGGPPVQPTRRKH